MRKVIYLAGLIIVILFSSSAAAQLCLTPADVDCSGDVNLTEVTDYIRLWYGCSSCYPELFQVIEAYYGIQPPSPPSYPDDYVSWWKFDGDAVDEMGVNNGSFHGNAITIYDPERDYGPDTDGHVLSLDGNGGNYVDTGSDMIGTGEATISAWINARTYGQSNVGRIATNRKARFRVGAGGRITFSSDGELTTARSEEYAIGLDEWYHVAVARDSSGSATFYVNGVDKTQSSYSGAPVSGTTNLRIGDDGINYPFNGSIDDVMIFNRSLSSVEIRAIFDTNKVFCTGIRECSDYDTGPAHCENNTCDIDSICEWDAYTGICEKVMGYCGDGVCNRSESCSACPSDCGPCPPVTKCAVDSDCASKGPGFFCNAIDECEWKPIIGIPSPNWGIDTSHMMYADPGYTYNYAGEGGVLPYHIGPNGPYTHYIDPAHPNATDDNNPYGTHTKPRSQVDIYNIHRLPAGSVVEIHNADLPTTSTFECLGTADRPVFIRGIADEEPTYRSTLDIDCDYLIIEGIKFDLGNRTGKSITIGTAGNAVKNIAIRGCEFYGGERDPSGTIPVVRFVLNGDGRNKIENIFVYDNYFHNIADGRTGSIDATAVSADVNVENVWIVDNLIHHIGGDGVQLAHDYSPAVGNMPNHIYIGRNVFHDNYENAVDLKKAEDIIISENIAYNFGSEGYDMSNPHSYAFRYGRGAAKDYPGGRARIWTIFNTVFNTSSGEGAFGTHSEYGYAEPIATEQYYIGNVVYNAHNSAGDASAFKGGSTIKAGYINNVVYNADLGISWFIGTHEPDEEIIIVNNIFSEGSSSYRGFMELGTSQANETDYKPLIMSNNLFHEASGAAELSFVEWNNASGRLESRKYSIDEFKASRPEFARGTIEADPMFGDADNNIFNLSSVSPAIDNGAVSGVYDYFYNLYGIDVKKDKQNIMRPQDGDNNGTAEWDIGAYEYLP